VIQTVGDTAFDHHAPPPLAHNARRTDNAAMRADATQLQEQITASVSLLRRHL